MGTPIEPLRPDPGHQWSMAAEPSAAEYRRPAQRSPRSRTTTVAVAVAVAATLIAACTSAGAFWAVTRSDATSGGITAPSASERTEPVSDASDESAAYPGPSAASDPAAAANTTPQYVLHYEKQELKVPPAAPCRKDVDIDVDLPQVQNGSADLVRRSCARPDSLEFADSTGSLDAKPGQTAAECVDQIRRAPVTEGSEVLISSLKSGSVICLQTSQQSALRQGTPQRVVLLEIGGLDARNVLTIMLTAWDIPE